MASAEGPLGSSPLKAPAVEIVDLLSDNESVDGIIPEGLIKEENEEDDEDGEDGEDDWSLYEDALAEMGENGSVDHCMWTRLHSEEVCKLMCE